MNTDIRTWNRFYWLKLVVLLALREFTDLLLVPQIIKGQELDYSVSKLTYIYVSNRRRWFICQFWGRQLAYNSTCVFLDPVLNIPEFSTSWPSSSVRTGIHFSIYRSPNVQASLIYHFRHKPKNNYLFLQQNISLSFIAETRQRTSSDI